MRLVLKLALHILVRIISQQSITCHVFMRTLGARPVTQTYYGPQAKIPSNASMPGKKLVLVGKHVTERMLRLDCTPICQDQQKCSSHLPQNATCAWQNRAVDGSDHSRRLSSSPDAKAAAMMPSLDQKYGLGRAQRAACNSQYLLCPRKTK